MEKCSEKNYYHLLYGWGMSLPSNFFLKTKMENEWVAVVNPNVIHQYLHITNGINKS